MLCYLSRVIGYFNLYLILIERVIYMQNESLLLFIFIIHVAGNLYVDLGLFQLIFHNGMVDDFIKNKIDLMNTVVRGWHNVFIFIFMKISKIFF